MSTIQVDGGNISSSSVRHGPGTTAQELRLPWLVINILQSLQIKLTLSKGEFTNEFKNRYKSKVPDWLYKKNVLDYKFKH